MVEKICQTLIRKMKIAMPEIDEQRAEVIQYGLQNIIGEIPKLFILFLIAYLLGIWQLALLGFLVILPYRMTSGGFHLHTHIGCIIATTLMYCGNAFLSKSIILSPIYLKYVMVALVWIFAIMMITKYAPADTENVPILRKQDRRKKRNSSYIVVTISLLISLLIQDSTISNLILFGMLFQTITITRFAYRITGNKYGYEIYETKDEVKEGIK